jgi:hypothetical protein
VAVNLHAPRVGRVWSDFRERLFSSSERWLRWSKAAVCYTALAIHGRRNKIKQSLLPAKRLQPFYQHLISLDFILFDERLVTKA